MEINEWKIENIVQQCGDFDTVKREAEALKAENARLQSIIDEANAQEPVSNVHVFYDTSDYESGVDRCLTWDTFGSNFKSLGVGKHKLYARPIPAQQSPSVAVPKNNLYSTDQFLEVDRSKVPVAYYLPAVPGYHERVTLTEQSARHWSAHMGTKIVEMVPYRSPRITEQDAREIYEVIRDIVQNYECGDKVDSMLRPLLNKLNNNQ